jgi:hypothetical protein
MALENAPLPSNEPVVFVIHAEIGTATLVVLNIDGRKGKICPETRFTLRQHTAQSFHR